MTLQLRDRIRPRFIAFESIEQVLERASSGSSCSDDSKFSTDETSSSSLKRGRRTRERGVRNVRFDDEAMKRGNEGDLAADERKRPSALVRKETEVREVCHERIFRPLPISLWQLWETQARFTAMMQAQTPMFVNPGALMHSQWTAWQTPMMMMQTMNPLTQFAAWHPSFDAFSAHGMAWMVAQQTYQTAFAQQLLRYTCAGPGWFGGMMPQYGFGCSNPYGGVPHMMSFPPTPVYGGPNAMYR